MSRNSKTGHMDGHTPKIFELLFSFYSLPPPYLLSYAINTFPFVTSNCAMFVRQNGDTVPKYRGV